MTDSSKIAVVFSGGGARGAYQIGVWEALQELGLVEQVSAVYGTSVGAINGAAFIQQDLQLAKDIWKDLNYQNVFAKFSKEKQRIRPRKRYYNWVKDTIKEKGMDVEPLKAIIRESLSEEVIRNSDVEFGLVTYDLTHREAKYLTKTEIPEGELIEYVIASSTFPTFQPHRIQDSIYIDGGVVDNRPVWFLSDEHEIQSVICVDVTMARHFWTSKRKVGDYKVNFIRPSRLLGSPLAFRPDKIARNMALGYEDAMKQLTLSGILNSK